MKSLYKAWPDEHLAAELFAMRAAVAERPDDAPRWRDRLAAAEREAKRRTPKRRRYREPIGQRIARMLLAPVFAPEPNYRDFEQGARYVIEDDHGDLWGVGPADECKRLSLLRRGHLRCVLNSRRDRVLVWTEWEYPTPPGSGEGDR